MRICKFIIFITVLCSCKCYGQQACTNTPFNCNANLVNALYDSTDITVIRDISYAKEGIDSARTLSDIAYERQCSNVKACDYSGAALKYDVYFPSSHNYSSCPLPVIFLFHPGNYSDCSKYSGSIHYSMLFAQRGFIAVNVEYRRGTYEDPSYRVSASKLLAVYKASQDLRGAIRSVIARQLDGTSTGFIIDTSNIFLGNAGTTPLNVAYIITQKASDEITPGVSSVLGTLYADNYYGSENINYRIKGVFNESGGLLVGATKEMKNILFEQNIDTLPALISFHGELDKLISPDIKYQFYSVSQSYKSESFCLNNKTLTVPASKYPRPDILYLGSGYLYKALSAKGVPCELYLDSKMEHDLGSTSGFGTGSSNPYIVQEYIAQRAATFFQAVINNKAGKLRTTVFRDCENFRYGCNTADNNDDCPVRNVQRDNEADKTQQPDLFMVKQANRQVYITMNKAADTQAEIYNYNGNRIKAIRSFNKEIVLDLSGEKSGVFVIKVTQSSAMQSKKIFLE